MPDLSFRCFKCNTFSGLHLTAEGRVRVERMLPDPNASREVTFYCDRCGAANAIALTTEMISQLLERVTSDDPAITKAIEDARRGDYGAAIDQARKRFGW
ncbi:MAG: hypothetical protein IT359_18355 [Gemmatimonadaceae bacterium]|nr:hypothetical protein [Gemmatimonadaceae bacterium]